MRRWRRYLGLGILAFTVAGCASYSDTMLNVERGIGSGNYEQALKLLQKQPGPARDRVLYLLNQGALLQMMGQYQQSNASFEAAKTLMQQLDATSVSETTGSVTVNDSMRSYVGDPYEKVMVHVYEALNYLMLDSLDSARVEVMQMDLTIRKIKEKKGSYRDDPFGRYLAGMIYEQLKQYSDAMVSYRLAYKAYTEQFKLYHVAIPATLKLDMLRVSEYLGLRTENRQLQREFGISQWPSMADFQRQGHVVVLFNNGLAPVKLESWIQVNNYDTGKVNRIAIPYYRSRPNPYDALVVEAGGQSVRSEMIENIDAIAQLTLKDQLPGIKARALLRAIAKDKMVDEGKNRSDMAGLFVNIMTVATERADTRSWMTLPQNVQLARLDLAPGDYTLQFKVVNQGGEALRNPAPEDLTLAPGQTRFVLYRAISPVSVGGRR